MARPTKKAPSSRAVVSKKKSDVAGKSVDWVLHEGKTKEPEGPLSARYVKPYMVKESVNVLLRQAYLHINRTWADVLNRHRLNVGMWWILRALEQEDGITQRELADRIGLSGPTIVEATESLERMGLVKRVPSKTDKRKFPISLTPKAMGIIDDLMPNIEDLNNTALKGFTAAEAASLQNLLRRVCANFKENTPD